MHSAASSQNSVHYVTVSSGSGQSLRIVADVGPKEGMQQIVVTDHGQTGPATLIAKNDTVYFRGNAFTLHVYFGLPTAKATKYAGKWISVKNSDLDYAGLSAGLTFSSYLDQLFQPLTNPSLVHAPMQNLVGVHGTVPQQTSKVAVTIFAPAQGKPLPVKQTAKSSGTFGAGVTTMSRWGEPVHVSAPANAISITKLG